jgi:uncharacterized protein YhjY with autotransporter beta-barrel domain
LAIGFGASGLRAQTAPPASDSDDSLTVLVNSNVYAFNQLEKLSAYANQATYDALTTNPGGAIYCNPAITAPTATCPLTVFRAFSNVRELVDTANQILKNGGPTFYSLNVPPELLGFDLRWTASEELNAPATAATEFSRAQEAGITSRISALRMGATGFSVAGIPFQPYGEAAAVSSLGPISGGGASADENGLGIASRWGGFLNGSFGWGERAPSVLDDAFAFDSTDATLGVDYRFTRHFVLGLMAGYTDQRIDFNSSLSVVGGKIRSTGYNLELYGMYEWDGPYVSFSAGIEHMDYGTTRLITYPSFNINVSSVNATATGSTASYTYSGTLSAGWAFNYKAFTAEPYVSADYRHFHLNGFNESSVDNDTGAPAGFGQSYATQAFGNVDTATGVRLQLTATAPFGVATGYVKGEFHHLFDDQAGSVLSSYSGVPTATPEFNLPNDLPTENFIEFAGGVSIVLKYGIQAFAQYETSARIQYVSTHLISGGIRGEF